MSLYDDIIVSTNETITVNNPPEKEKTEPAPTWNSGIKLLQSQLQLKKATFTQSKKETLRRPVQSLPPVIDLKTKKEEETLTFHIQVKKDEKEDEGLKEATHFVEGDPDWIVDDEYDPFWPNDYEKVVNGLMFDNDELIKQIFKDMHEQVERERAKEEEERKRKEAEEREKRKRERYNEDRYSGFSKLRECDADDESDKPKHSGAAIAPPPSLMEPQSCSENKEILAPVKTFPGMTGSSVAAKIMARYGFKEGQGLGKQEQGIATALAVEKTSKRGGRIIDAKELMPPPNITSLPSDDLKSEPSITEIMKNPSKVVLLRNMVGPGEVDQDLEPEVKDECHNKYGDVNQVIIFELTNHPDDEAVRIFVEFKRIESAIKAVVDLNGRFFGGRQVKAGFYETEKFQNLQLGE